MYLHKSGSKKRKEKREQDQEEEKLRNKNCLLKFFKKKKSTEEGTAECIESSEKDVHVEQEEDTASCSTSFVTDPEVHAEYPQEGETQSGHISSIVENIEEELDWKDPAVWSDVLTDKDRERIVIRGLGKEEQLKEMIKGMDKDCEQRSFSEFLLYSKSSNGREKITRDWLRWSTSKHVLYCVTCLAFCSDRGKSTSFLCRKDVFNPSKNKWHFLYKRLPEHENSIHHKQHYWSWRKLEMSIAGHGMDSQLQKSLDGETHKFAALLEKLLDVTLFLASRNLAFRGSSQRVGDLHNGNLIGVLELIAHYDPLLQEHLEKVKRSQESGRKLHAHYLSWATQNEFINLCGKHVLDTILSERENAIYFSVICDATPDVSHTEQNLIVLRYLHRDPVTENWIIQERFIEFFDFTQKTGEEIAEKLLLRLSEHGINLTDCRGQGFDNGANMSGKNKGVRAHIQKKYPKAVFSPCASHSLNLVGVHAASCCPDVITFFGCVNHLHVLFSGSPARWKILKDEIGSSLHALSDTRWSARVEAVRPVALKLPGIIEALEKVISSGRLSSEAHSEAVGLKDYFSSFKAIILATFWVKVLQSFEERNKILQARSVSLEIGAENIKSLSLEMQALRDRWTDLLSEAKLVADELKIPKILKGPRRIIRPRKHQSDVCIEPEGAETEFKVNVFFVALDSVISELNQRFQSMEKVCCLFAPILKLRTLSELVKSTENLVSYYSEDLTNCLVGELKHLRKVYDAIFSNDLAPLNLLNAIYKLQLEGIFGEICVALRIFNTIPLSVAEGERAFSKLSLKAICGQP